MKEFNKDVQIVSYTIDSVNEKELNCSIYEEVVKDLDQSLKVEEGHKLRVLDMFARESYVRDVQPNWMDYVGLDYNGSYLRNDENVVVEIVGDPNNIPSKANAFDVVFTVGNKFGYGVNHNSLFEIERVIKPGGWLLVSLSKYWFYKEINQLLLGYRSWDYTKAVEINYQIVESKIDSAKYFCYYRYKG
jgi:SAM-dependent methyltransferase